MSEASAVLIFGATRGVGLETARLARSQGWEVHALVRKESEELARLGVRQHLGDALDAACVLKVCEACGDVDAVISTMSGGAPGVSADFVGVGNAVDGAKAAGIGRFILVTSLGCGESRAHASERLLQAIGMILDEKTRGENRVMESGLRYTVIRPGRLVDAAQDGGGRLVEDPGVHGDIGRCDLAELLMICVRNSGAEGKVYSAVGSGFLKEV